MSSPVRKKRKTKHEETMFLSEENVLSFSYDVACPLLRGSSELRQDLSYFEWRIIEKGSEKPKLKYEISYDKIRKALFQIRKYILKTPFRKLLNDENLNIYVKKELDQPTNSVKARGVIYTLLQLSDEQKRKGVIGISTGNFAYTLCYYGKKFGIPVTVVMPTSAAHEKVANMCRMHADSRVTVLVHGSDMLEAHKIALRIAKTKGLFYLDGNDHPNMIIGQSTLGLEIMEQMTNIDAVVLPTTIDGCGLITGIALAIKGWNSDIQIIEVQPTVFDSLIENIREQTTSPYELEIPMTKYTGYFGRASIPDKWIDTIITVDETLVNHAANLLLKKENVIDSRAAIGLAAMLGGGLDELKEKNVVVPLFGNMDSTKELSTNKRNLLVPHAGPSGLLR